MSEYLPIHISDEDLDVIQNMAACNFAPSDIAMQIGFEVSICRLDGSNFILVSLWREKNCFPSDLIFGERKI
jgi:hypothetical protein